MSPTGSGSDLRTAALSVARCDGEGPITLSDRRGDRRSDASPTGRYAIHDRPALRLVENCSPILIAGGEEPRRASLLADLSETLPEGTVFEELSTLAEVLERAPASRMVILSGGLDDLPARELARILGQRYPTLPVISVDLPNTDDL
ncbi:MAG TPA: hypothetical protein VNZ01_15605 [Solirubrobacteraceae bacterium]|nr:hypothetical protein [Solirubrobacteraceae bacterium]